ncbi:hypothetical protein [Enhygromyxa salina]|uniref:hypothetical protein n=1 Tax=Enhygromyxa salina TaxID=215803 RepID=UPI0006966042|nr:hypothetical protein [Enhygromyxa salina]
MYEPVYGFRSSKLLAVLLGMLLWLPVMGPKLAVPGQAVVTCADAGGTGVGEVGGDAVPTEAREGEDGEGAKTSADRTQLCGPRSSLLGGGSIRVGVGAYERERLSSGHGVQARGRSPPVV